MLYAGKMFTIYVNMFIVGSRDPCINARSCINAGDALNVPWMLWYMLEHPTMLPDVFGTVVRAETDRWPNMDVAPYACISHSASWI